MARSGEAWAEAPGLVIDRGVLGDWLHISRRRTWEQQHVAVQAVGVTPFPGETDPRIIGLVAPFGGSTENQSLAFVRGDVTKPRGQGVRVIGHVVNNRSRSWRGARLSNTLLSLYPGAHEEYERWVAKGSQTLGGTHLVRAAEDLWICSMVAQEGYGRSSKPRLRYGALEKSLGELSAHARALGGTIHLPLLGTGQGRGEWPLVKQLIYEQLGDLVGQTTIYVLPEATLPEDAVRQLSLLG